MVYTDDGARDQFTILRQGIDNLFDTRFLGCAITAIRGTSKLASGTHGGRTGTSIGMLGLETGGAVLILEETILGRRLDTTSHEELEVLEGNVGKTVVPQEEFLLGGREVLIGFVKDQKETACSSSRFRVELELALSAITSGDFLESRAQRAKIRRV